jgi:hypothetical protein
MIGTRDDTRLLAIPDLGFNEHQLSKTGIDPERPVVNGGFGQFGAHGWQERMECECAPGGRPVRRRPAR